MQRVGVKRDPKLKDRYIFVLFEQTLQKTIIVSCGDIKVRLHMVRLPA